MTLQIYQLMALVLPTMVVALTAKNLLSRLARQQVQEAIFM